MVRLCPNKHYHTRPEWALGNHDTVIFETIVRNVGSALTLWLCLWDVVMSSAEIIPFLESFITFSAYECSFGQGSKKGHACVAR